MESELLYPLVPVTLIELGTVSRVSEQPGPLAHLRTKSLVEGPEAARSELVPDAGVPVVVGPGQLPEDGGPVLGGSGDGGHSLPHLLPSPRLLSNTHRLSGPSARPRASAERSSRSETIGAASVS